MGEKIKPIDIEAWTPKTMLGKMVKAGEISTLEQIFESGRKILEPEIVDVLLKDIEVETLLLKSTQRVTDSGRRTQFRVAVVIGDKNGHVGIGVGKADEVKPALESAIKDAKKNIISVKTGCGSWECRCNQKHSIPQKTVGKEGSTEVTLKPAPRGLGLAANDVVKKVLSAAGIKDVWSFSRGGKNVYNTAMATLHALDKLNNLKVQPEN
jgi:small subunit ribosomal protein S5